MTTLVCDSAAASSGFVEKHYKLIVKVCDEIKANMGEPLTVTVTPQGYAVAVLWGGRDRPRLRHLRQAKSGRRYETPPWARVRHLQEPP